MLKSNGSPTRGRGQGGDTQPASGRHFHIIIIIIIIIIINRLLFKSGFINNWIWGSIWLVFRTSLPEGILVEYLQGFSQTCRVP